MTQQEEKLEQLAMQALAADRKAFTLQDTLDRERAAHAREIDRLREKLADAEAEGCTLHGHAPHGKEAEELRKGIEQLLMVPPRSLRRGLEKLLDSVDARDSLAFLRANEELESALDKLKELGR